MIHTFVNKMIIVSDDFEGQLGCKYSIIEQFQTVL